MNKNQKNYNITTVLIVVGAALAVFLGWAIWQSQQLKTTTNNQQSTQKTEDISVAKTALPAGWAQNERDSSSGRPILENKGTKCSIDALYTTDTMETHSADINQQKYNIDGLREKNMTVTELKSKQVTLTTHSGAKQFPAQSLKVVDGDSSTFRNYVFITESAYYVRVEISCPTESLLQAAQPAVSAISFNKF